MRERDFQRRIEDMATRFGWKWWHVPAPMRHDRTKGFVPARSAAGLPDLILLHDDPPRLVFMEVKGDGGRLSDEQQEFLQAAKTVAEAPCVLGEGWVNVSDVNPLVQRVIGVMAVWPKDEAAVEQMLRSKVVV